MKEISLALKGRVRVAVLEGKRTIQQGPWQDNLILDQGMDQIATTLFNQLFSACAAGNNNSPTTIDPLSQATVSGQNLTITTGSYQFTNTDLDSNVHFDSGQMFKIQSVVSPTQVTLFTSGSVATATHFMILRVNEVQLGNELKRTVVCSSVPGANSGSFSGGTVLLQRTLLFSPETSPVTYSEVGFSSSAAPGPNLFSRVVLAQPVTVNGPSSGAPMGQQLQVTYQLSIGIDYGQGPGVFFSGTTPTTIVVSGLPIASAIWAYANSGTQPGNLSVSISPQAPVKIGDSVTLSGSSVAGYNGTWAVLAQTIYFDSVEGWSSILTLQVPFTTAPTSPDGGVVKVSEAGVFFRACPGIFFISAAGGSAAPPLTPDVFQGYGEPSIAGIAWIGNDPAASLGSNNVPVRSGSAQTGACQLEAYTAGNYYIDKKATFTVQSGDPIYSFGIGLPNLTDQIETWAWEQGQPLGSGNTFSITFRFSWNRMTF